VNKPKFHMGSKPKTTNEKLSRMVVSTMTIGTIDTYMVWYPFPPHWFGQIRQTIHIEDANPSTSLLASDRHRILTFKQINHFEWTKSSDVCMHDPFLDIIGQHLKYFPFCRLRPYD